MAQKQSFWRGSAVLMLSAVVAKVLGACFKIPLTNALGGTGMGYFSCAYGLFLPVYALSITGLSAAVSQTVSQAAALGHWQEVRRIHWVGRLACGALGLALSLGIFLLAQPFAVGVAAQPEALLSILAIAPAALFGCLTAVERGYAEGLQNMTPTAISQALEALAKLGLGLYFCRWVLANPAVVCRYVPAQVPLSALAAAGAVWGVTLSTLVGWLYFGVRHLWARAPHPDLSTTPPPAPWGQLLRRLFYVMIPVALGSLVTNLTSLLDLVTVMRGLGWLQFHQPAALIRRFGAIAAQRDFPAFVYGAFTGMAVTVFNLVPSVTNMLGKSALPCAASLWAREDGAGLARHTSGVVTAAAAMAVPAAGGLWVLAEPVMELLYQSCADEADIAAAALRALLPGMVFLCLTVPLCSVLQGMGRPMVPVACMLMGVGVKLVGNLVLLRIPATCVLGAGIATSACYGVMLVVLLIWLRRILGRPLHLLWPLCRVGASGALCTLAAALCRNFLSSASPLVMVVCCTAVGGGVYLLSLWLLCGRRSQGFGSQLR